MQINYKSLFQSAAVALAVAIPLVALAAQSTTAISSIDISPQGCQAPGTTFTVSGSAIADPPPGLASQYHIQIDWDDGTVNDEQETSAFGPEDPSTRSYSDSHAYSTGGSYTVTARIYHQTPPGNDGEAIATASVEVCVTSSTGSLTVTKVVSGGTLGIQDFPLFLDGMPVTSGVASTTGAGSHTVSETSQANYTGVFSGDCNASVVVNVPTGGSASCTIPNIFVQPTGSLTVIKAGINDNLGTKGVGDFPLLVGGMSVSSGVATTTSEGTHVVSETNSAGYTATFSGDCDSNGNVTVSSTTPKTCTITNDDQPAKLTVTKIVDNNDGGTLGVGDFPLFVDDGSVNSGEQNSFNAGTYAVSETNQSGYMGTIGGDCDSDGNITLAPGDVKECTVTNDDIVPGLTVIKTVTNDNGGTKEVSDFTLYIDEDEVTSGHSNELSAGSYEVSEDQLSGYTSVIGGDCDVDGNVTLWVGETKVCTIVNDDLPGTLHVVKIVDNEGGGDAVPSDFTFSVNEGETTPIGEDGTKDVTVDAGVYSVVEDSAENYTATYENCDEVSIGNGEEATCTITNTYVPTPTACSAGIDNDGDDLIDYPADPGCSSAEDTDETNSPPSGPFCGLGERVVDGQCVPIRETSSGGSVVGGGGGGGQVLGASIGLGEVLGALSCPEHIRSYIKFGRSNNLEDVVRLQLFLNQYENAGLKITGVYDTATQAAVNAFQLKYGINVLRPWVVAGLHPNENIPTGYFYKTTRWWLNALYCNTTE